MQIILRKFLVPVIKLQYLRTFRVFYSTSISYQEHKIKVDKYNINYLKVGHGAYNVLCLPGAMGTIWTDFKPQIEGFDRENFTLIVWDAPGYGKSIPPEREFRSDYFGQDVDTAYHFMKALNIPKFSLMGWSYGGATSMILAARHPEAVHKMVLWGTSSKILRQEIETYLKIKDVTTWSEKKRKPMVETYGEEKFAKLWARVVDAMLNMYNSNDSLDDIWKLSKNVKCPTLILYGEKDPLIDKSHIDDLRTIIQGSRIHIYPEGKHAIHTQYAQDFNLRVQNFLLED